MYAFVLLAYKDVSFIFVYGFMCSIHSIFHLIGSVHSFLRLAPCAPRVRLLG